MQTCVIFYNPAIPGLTLAQSRDCRTGKAVGIPGSGIPGLYTLFSTVLSLMCSTVIPQKCNVVKYKKIWTRWWDDRWPFGRGEGCYGFAKQGRGGDAKLWGSKQLPVEEIISVIDFFDNAALHGHSGTTAIPVVVELSAAAFPKVLWNVRLGEAGGRCQRHHESH